MGAGSDGKRRLRTGWVGGERDGEGASAESALEAQPMLEVLPQAGLRVKVAAACLGSLFSPRAWGWRGWAGLWRKNIGGRCR